MSAHIVLNLINKLMKNDKKQGFAEHLIRITQAGPGCSKLTKSLVNVSLKL